MSLRIKPQSCPHCGWLRFHEVARVETPEGDEAIYVCDECCEEFSA